MDTVNMVEYRSISIHEYVWFFINYHMALLLVRIWPLPTLLILLDTITVLNTSLLLSFWLKCMPFTLAANRNNEAQLDILHCNSIDGKFISRDYPISDGENINVKV